MSNTDDEGKPGYKCISILPTVLSKDSRKHQILHVPEVKIVDFRAKRFSSDEAREYVNADLYLLHRDSAIEGPSAVFPHIRTLMSVGHDMAGVNGVFTLLSTYRVKRCYACHRTWRGDIGAPCSGTVCPYSGRYPFYDGNVATRAMIAWIKAGHPSFSISDDVAEEENVDVYFLMENSRCELSGTAFVCTDTSGSQMRPCMVATLRINRAPVEKACCVACWARFDAFGLVTDVRPLKPAYKSFRLVIHDRDSYDEELSKLFIGIETPTMFKKTFPFKIPSFNDSADQADIIDYMMSCQGTECQLISPFSVNNKSMSELNRAMECDAWDTQSGMSPDDYQHFNMQVKVSNLTLFFPKSGMNRWDHMAEETSYLGPRSAIIRQPGADIDSALSANTRFVIEDHGDRIKYIPVTNPVSDHALPSFVEQLPFGYLQSLAHTLVHYRQMINSVYNYNRNKSTRLSTARITESQTYLTYRSVQTESGDYRLMNCGNDFIIPPRPVMTFHDLYAENLCGVRRDDPRVRKVGGRPSYGECIDTPYFIWQQVLNRPEILRDLENASLSDITRYNSMNAIRASYSKCYLVWDDNKGMLIKFYGNPDLSLRWGKELRVSSLLASRSISSLQLGPESYVITSIREVPIHALNVTRAGWFGPGRSR